MRNRVLLILVCLLTLPALSAVAASTPVPQSECGQLSVAAEPAIDDVLDLELDDAAPAESIEDAEGQPPLFVNACEDQCNFYHRLCNRNCLWVGGSIETQTQCELDCAEAQDDCLAMC